MVVEVKSVLESKFISHTYPYTQLLQLYSKQQFSGFYEVVQKIEKQLISMLERQHLDYYKLARLTTYYPNSHTEKTSGLILEDGSYLQIDFLFAHHLKSLQMYLLFFSLHYGRCDATKNEFYFFRFDKESDYSIDEQLMDFKSVYHFHGNSDEPHFPLPSFQWNEKLEYTINLLGKNLQRIEEKTGESVF